MRMDGGPAARRIGADQLDDLRRVLERFEPCRAVAAAWGFALATRLEDGGRLLVAGNGGSAAQAQHLTAEIVGRFRRDRAPFSAVSLTSDTSTLTALANDYGASSVFARQVSAHARPGDVVLLMSTSGRSANLLHAANAARVAGATTWAMTGPVGNPLAERCDAALCVPSERPSTVQECHLLSLHLLCAAFDAAILDRPGSSREQPELDLTDDGPAAVVASDPMRSTTP